MKLNQKQLDALTWISNTFAAGDGHTPNAESVGVPVLITKLVDRNPRAGERKQLESLLKIWDSKAFGLLSGAGFAKFSSLPQADRERFLLSYADSRVPQKRALFQALKMASTLAYYVSPDAAAVWETMGYPGPLGTLPSAPAKPLSPLRISTDTTLDCDVVIVGSGAGGGTAAGVLSEAGLDVVVLEAGDYYDDADFDGGEWSGFTRLYAGAPTVTADGQIGLLAGACLGGGTVVNYTTSFRTPDDVRAEWASLGATQFTGDEYTAALDAVCARLGVNQNNGRISSTDEYMEKGLRELGWHIDEMPRNVKACDLDEECGRCGYGCRIGSKQSTAKTWLNDAADRGARLIVGANVRIVVVKNGQAAGVSAITANGSTLTVSSRAVIVAAGAIQTPALLKRSGLRNPNIGKYLRLHPVSLVGAEFDEDVRPWTGGMQTRYSTQHRDLDGKGYGVIYETGPANPGVAVSLTPWRGSGSHLDRMQKLRTTSAVAWLVRDQGSGQVKIGRDGEPIVKYRLTGPDAAHFARGFEGAVEIMEAAGAKRIHAPHQSGLSYAPATDNRDDFIAACHAGGYGPGRCLMASFHIMGSARMRGTAADSAVNPDGATWDVPNLVVADGSCFPTASGVNPMISIESIAYMNAKRLAAALA
ncbi:MAG: GMC family oxidoreductase [Nocardiaceae bacterium]|nr:GMC family oxidoreductase [Nocardiaceae bacterium]